MINSFIDSFGICFLEVYFKSIRQKFQIAPGHSHSTQTDFSPNWYPSHYVPTQTHAPTAHKVVEQDKFDPNTTEWTNYMAYFEHVAHWNRWNDGEKAQRLIMCLRGSAQKILSELTYHRCTNYITLTQVLNRRFNPKEREREREIVVSLETEKER